LHIPEISLRFPAKGGPKCSPLPGVLIGITPHCRMDFEIQDVLRSPDSGSTKARTFRFGIEKSELEGGRFRSDPPLPRVAFETRPPSTLTRGGAPVVGCCPTVNVILSPVPDFLSTGTLRFSPKRAKTQLPFPLHDYSMAEISALKWLDLRAVMSYIMDVIESYSGPKNVLDSSRAREHPLGQR